MSNDPLPLPPLSRPPPPLAKAERRADTAPTTGILPATTLAIWLMCLAVGGIGMKLHYPPVRLAPVEAPVVAKFIHVDLTQGDTPADASDASQIPAPSPSQPQIAAPPPPITAPPVPNDAPPLTAVAEPSPAIAFALPVAGPSQTVDPGRAVPTNAPAAPAPNATATPVKRLTFGRGEGAQPAPEYPREAERAGQEGIVNVRFAVAENGKVLSADLVTPCRWPMLNQAALRVIRDNWRFPPGEKRLYEIAIKFQLREP